MKILHLADLHLGKKLNDYSLIADQKYVLNQAVSLVENQRIEAVFICGDIFDRAVASSEALELFGDFIFDLNKLQVKIYIIAGNHDNIDRLSYLSDLIRKSDIYISKNFSGEIAKYSLDDDINVYLMPFLYPQLIKKYYPEAKIINYNDAIKTVIEHTFLDDNKINILLAHQFVISNELTYSKSEHVSVGGLDAVLPSIFEKFNYVALGHLHCQQKVVSNKIRYGGSILKYSFSEINQKKVFTVLNVVNKKIELEFFEIKFLHELCEYRGYIDDFLNEKFYSKINQNDLIHFILLDETAFDAKKKLSAIYPNILCLEFDNSLTKTLSSSFKSNISSDKSIAEHFFDFYEIQCLKKMNKKQKDITIKLSDKIKGDSQCVL